MFFVKKTQRAARPSGVATDARAQIKEISFALVPMEEAQARGFGGARGSRPGSTSTTG